MHSSDTARPSLMGSIHFKQPHCQTQSCKAMQERQSFKRDLMLSFKGDMFYYASDTPDGFFRPGRKSLNDERLLEQLYREIDFCRTVEEELK